MNTFQNVLSTPRRAGGRTVKNQLSDLGVLGAGVFWLYVHCALLIPWDSPFPTNAFGMFRMGLLVMLTLLLSMSQSLVVPALLAQVLPSTKAGMYLLEFQWKTLGFVLLLGVTGFLCWTSIDMLRAFYAAQASVALSGRVWMYTILTFSVTAIIPALVWSASSPGHWFAEVTMSQEVERMRRDHQADLLLAEAAVVRAYAIMAAGLDQATVEQRSYVADVVRAMHTAHDQRTQKVVKLLGELVQMDVAIPDNDPYRTARLDVVAKAVRDTGMALTPRTLERGLDAMNRNPWELVEASTGETLELDPASNVPNVPDVSQDRSQDAFDDDGPSVTARKAQALVGRSDWTVRDLAERMNGAESTVRSYLDMWKDAGLVEPGAMRGRYRFTF